MSIFFSKGMSMPSSSRVGVRRTSYPSGSWVDQYGRPAQSPNKSYNPPPVSQQTKMPDPSNWKVIKAEEKSGYLILWMQYPNCTNYEGNKILVFSGVTLIDLVNQRLIDPHFFKEGKYKSPVARFEPTDQGWKMAQVFVQAWVSAGHGLR